MEQDSAAVAIDAQAAYIAGHAAGELLLRVQVLAMVTLTDDAKARILTALRDLLVPEIATALRQQEPSE